MNIDITQLHVYDLSKNTTIGKIKKNFFKSFLNGLTNSGYQNQK